MWTFEPSVALKIYQDWIRENEIPVVYNERLDRKSGVAMTRSVPWRSCRSGWSRALTFAGKMFLDATYEGDLMAAANVAYTVGREANSQYGETLNGVQTRNAVYHQFVTGVDPYVTPGDPDSGLLPFLDPTGPAKKAAATGESRPIASACA
jgi:hypothetical protein